MNDAATIGEARAYVRQGARRGTRCPCCGSVVKIRERRITPVMGQGLVLACRYLEHMTGGSGWIDLGWFFKTMHRRGLIHGKESGGDYAKLRFFGLIEPKKPIVPPATRSGGGRWGITQLCRGFVHGHATVPETTYVCMNELVGASDARVRIADVLGEARYADLMRPDLPWKEWSVGLRPVEGATS